MEPASRRIWLRNATVGPLVTALPIPGSAPRPEIEQIDVLKSDRVIHRHFPKDHVPKGRQWPGETLCRIEFGWGPWGALNVSCVCDWEIAAAVHGGKLISVTPCFQSGPFDETRRNRMVSRTGSGCRFQSYTSPKDAFGERATNSVLLHLAGGPGAEPDVTLSRPVAMSVRKKLGELAESNEVAFEG